MRILNWNTQWLSPRGRKGRFEAGRKLIAGHQADVVCLTEAREEMMPSGGQTITSEMSGAGNIENRGGRKVVLWSRYGWREVDTLGSPRLPEGRFVSKVAPDGRRLSDHNGVVIDLEIVDPR